MEKIKAALAKVKTTKKSRIRTDKPIAGSANTKKKVSRDIGEINYTSTRIVKLDSHHLEQNRVVSHLSHNANASVFDSLRTQILQKMEENDWQTLAIVSPTPESGKSLISINLTMSIARQPQKTAILVDFDLRKPRVAQYMGIQAEQSINEYLEGTAEIEDVLVNPSIQRLVIMPTMKPIARASEALASSKVEELLVELKERYESRIVVFDLPPLLSADDAMVVLPQVDCALLVVGNGVSTPTEIQDAQHMIPKEKLLGVIYNMAEEENKAYYY